MVGQIADWEPWLIYWPHCGHVHFICLNLPSLFSTLREPIYILPDWMKAGQTNCGLIDKSVIFRSAVFCCIYLSGSAIVIFLSPRIHTRFADWMQAGHSICADWELSLTDLLRTLWSNTCTYLSVHKIPPSVPSSEPQPSRMGETKVMKSAKTKCKSSLRSLFLLPSGNAHCMARKRRQHETTHRGNGPISVIQAKAFASQ